MLFNRHGIRLALLALVSLSLAFAMSMVFAISYAEVRDSETKAIELRFMRGAIYADLELYKLSLNVADIELVVAASETDQKRVPFPEVIALRGTIKGDPSSRVTLTVDKSGGLRGMMTSSTDKAILEGSLSGIGRIPKDGVDYHLVQRSTDSGQMLPRSLCSIDPDPHAGEDAAIESSPWYVGEVDANGISNIRSTYQIPLGLDTDHEYFQLFGSVHDAARYALDLVLAASAIYESDVQTELVLRYLRLWTNSADPWNQVNNQCQLRQFGAHWNANVRGTFFYSASLLLSAKDSLSGGLAWVDRLCKVPFSVTAPTGGCTAGFSGAGNFGGPFGVAAGIYGPTGGAGMTSDLSVFAHELGHIVGSKHTHCYAGIGGNSSPVDRCYGSEDETGCYSGAVQLPGPEGVGSGTIMSYCHLREGGESNIGFSLGRAHPYGVQPDRVPNLMWAALGDLYAQGPHCLTVNPPGSVVLTVEKDGPADTRILTFGASTPPYSIDCGNTCTSVRPATWGAGFLVESAPSPNWMVRSADRCPWREACGFYTNGECTPDDVPPVGNHQRVTVHVGAAATITLSSTPVIPVNQSLGIFAQVISTGSTVRSDRCDLHQSDPLLYPLPPGATDQFKVPAGSRVKLSSNHYGSDNNYFIRWNGACSDQSPPLRLTPIQPVECVLDVANSTSVHAVYGKAYQFNVVGKRGIGDVFLNGIPVLNHPNSECEFSGDFCTLVATGSVMRLEAAPRPGYAFVGFERNDFQPPSATLAICQGQSTCDVVVDRGMMINARMTATPAYLLRNNQASEQYGLSNGQNDLHWSIHVDSGASQLSIITDSASPYVPGSVMTSVSRLLVRRGAAPGIAVADCIRDGAGPDGSAGPRAQCVIDNPLPGRYFVSVRSLPNSFGLSNFYRQFVLASTDRPAMTYVISVASIGAEDVAIDSSTGHGTSWVGFNGTPYSVFAVLAGDIILDAPLESGSALFERWTGCDQTIGRTCRINGVNSNRAVVAVYTADTIFAGGFESPSL